MKRWINHMAANFATRTRAPTTTVKTRILISPATRLSMNPFHTMIQPSKTSTSTTHNNNCGNTTNHCGTMMKHYHHNTVHHDHNHYTHDNHHTHTHTSHNDNNNNNNNNNKTDEDLPFIRAEQLPSPLVTQQWFIHYCDTQSSSSSTTTNTTNTTTTNEKQQHALIQSIMNDITKERLFNSDTMNICVVLLDQPMNPLQNMNSFAKQLYDCWSMGNHTIIMTVNQTNHIGLYVVDEQNSIASRPVPSVFNKELIKQLTSMKKSTISREMQEDKSATATAGAAAMTTGENKHSTTVNTTTTPTTTTTNDVAAAAAIDYELVIQVLQIMLKKLKTQYSPISDQFLTAQQLKRKNLESIIQHHNGTNERFNRQYRHRKLHRMGNSIVEFQFQRVLGSMVLLVIVVYGAYSYWKSTSTCPNCDSFALKTKKTYDSNVISNDGQAMKEWEQLSSASLLTPNNKKEFELGSCSFTHKKCSTCQYETMQRTVNPSSSVGHCYKCDTLALTTEIKNQPQGRMVVRKCQFCGDEDVKPSAYQSS